MFCSKCGKEIDDSAVVCIYCGVGTQNFKQAQAQTQNQANQPIVINNNASASSSSSAAALAGPIRRRYSLLFDIFMICITAGFWIIWMILRPKYY